MEFEDFSNERLLNMWKQGEYYNDDKLKALMDYMKTRGLLTEHQAKVDLEQIKDRQKKLNQLNAEGKLDEDDKGYNAEPFWKTRYTYYVMILLILGMIILYLKTGIFVWYLPVAGAGAAVGGQTIFKRRIERRMKR